MSMIPHAEADVVGRHGQVGVDILPREFPPELLPGDAGELAAKVDGIEQRVAEMLRAERAAEIAHLAVASVVTIEL